MEFGSQPISRLPRAIKAATPDVEIVQYADNVTFLSHHSDTDAAARTMQIALNALSDWTNSNAVEIAAEKTELLSSL